jgi:TPR repeat protein
MASKNINRSERNIKKGGITIMDKKEFEELKQKAEQGDAEAQFQLGRVYYYRDIAL